eukprot:8278101-Pyramimonas_sp.AAC.1
MLAPVKHPSAGRLRKSQRPRDGLMVVPLRQPSAEPPRSPRKWEHSRKSQPPRTVRSHGGLRGTPLGWPSQEPTKRATLSQMATPSEPRGLVWVCVGNHAAGPPKGPP